MSDVDSSSSPIPPPSSSYAAGSCVFAPQHYRPSVCKLCFLSSAQHAPAAAAAEVPEAAPTRAAATSTTRITETNKTTGQQSEARARATSALRSRVALPFEPASADPVPPPAAVVAAASSSEAGDQDIDSEGDGSVNIHASANEDLSTSAISDHSSSSSSNARARSPSSDRQQNAVDMSSASDEETAVNDEKDALIEATFFTSDIGASSSLPPPPPPFDSSSSSSSTPFATRSSLLSAIQSRPTLRRASEQAPRKETIVVDLDSELKWALKRKRLANPVAAPPAVAADLTQEARDDLRALAHRLTALGDNPSHPASAEQIASVLASREEFVRANAAVLRSAASSLEEVDGAWPADKFELATRVAAAVARLDVAVRATRRYTDAFQSASAASSSRLSGDGTTDLMVVDSSLLASAIEAIIAGVENLNKIKSESSMATDVTSNLQVASTAASTLIDILFEKCRVAYETSFATTTVAGANTTAAGAAATSDASAAAEPSSSSSSSSSTSSSRLTPHYSLKSKALKSYRTLDVSLALYRRLNSSIGSQPLVHFTEEQSRLAEELLALKRAIESSEEYRHSISVSHRRGEWDKREEVQLRSTSRPASNSTSRGRSESALVVGSGGSAWTQPLRKLREAHQRLFLLIEKPAIAAVATVRANEETTGSLDDDESEVTSTDNDNSELSTQLQALDSISVPLLTQFVIRHVIPAQHTEAFRIIVSRLLRPALSGPDAEEARAAATQILFECAGRGFTEGVLLCIQDAEADSRPTLGLDVNLRSHSTNGGNTALHLAASNLHVGLVARLIREGASPLAGNSFERHALFHLRQLFGSTPDITNSSSAARATEAEPEEASLANHASAYMARYFNSPRLSDVRIRIVATSTGEESVFDAHRIVLCAQSEVFRMMLDEDVAPPSAAGSAPTPGWASSLDEDESGGVPSTTLEDIADVDAFRLFLRFLYTGVIIFTNDDLHVAAGVLQLATRFLVDPLRQRVAAHLVRRIVPQNARSLYNLACFTSSRALRVQVEKYVIANYEKHHREWNAAEEAESDLPITPPHSFLLRVLDGLDVDALKSAIKDQKPRWHL